MHIAVVFTHCAFLHGFSFSCSFCSADIHDTMQTVLETKLVLMGRDRQPLE